MVCTTSLGVENLHKMVALIDSLTLCRRVALAQNFAEPFNASQCVGKCDNCARTDKVIKKDVTTLAKLVASIVGMITNKKSEKLTMAQLCEHLRGKGRPGFNFDVSLIKSDKDMTHLNVERLVVKLVISGVLKEYHLHSPYATNAYVKRDYKAPMVESGLESIEMDLFANVPEKSKKSAPVGGEDFDAEQGIIDDLEGGMDEVDEKASKKKTRGKRKRNDDEDTLGRNRKKKKKNKLEEVLQKSPQSPKIRPTSIDLTNSGWERDSIEEEPSPQASKTVHSSPAPPRSHNPFVESLDDDD
jgi:superfamily II DNA helicase RecQ